MRKLALIALLFFASCKKENCNCYEVVKVYKSFNKVYAKNNCTNQISEYHVKSIDMWQYEKGNIVCDDVNFY